MPSAAVVPSRRHVRRKRPVTSGVRGRTSSSKRDGSFHGRSSGSAGSVTAICASGVDGGEVGVAAADGSPEERPRLAWLRAVVGALALSNLCSAACVHDGPQQARPGRLPVVRCATNASIKHGKQPTSPALAAAGSVRRGTGAAAAAGPAVLAAEPAVGVLSDSFWPLPAPGVVGGNPGSRCGKSRQAVRPPPSSRRGTYRGT